MKKNKVAVVGDLAFGESVYSGQTTKTRDYHYYLQERYGQKNVLAVDTRQRKKHPFRLIFQLLKACFTCKNFVLLLCTNGRRTVLPFLMRMRWLFRYRIFFSSVGGSLLYEFEEEKYLAKNFQKIDAVYVETKKMLQFFLEKGYTNVWHAPVFTRRKYDGELVVPNTFNPPMQLCTYSRVCREKGISDAIDAVNEINNRFGYTACTLDIFGEPIAEYREEFYQKIDNSNGWVVQRPFLNDQAINVLSEYYLMLFPTYYPGEGFPIAIVECMTAGLPVVATDWRFNSEVIIHNKTGIIYSKEKGESLTESIIRLINNPDLVRDMKMSSIENAKNYEPHAVLQRMFEQIEGKTE